MTDGDASASAEAEVRRHASKIDGVGEWSKGDKADRKDAIDRDDSAEGRERDQKAKEYFYLRMEYLGIWGEKRVQLVTSKRDGGRRRWEEGRQSRQLVPVVRGHG